jgi:hypothetical protein
MKKLLPTILIFALSWACSTRPSVPNDLPNEEKMAAVLADIYQTESVLSQSRVAYTTPKEDNVSGHYRFILEQYEMTKQDFDTAMGWYSAHPEILSEVYEDVIEIISERHAKLKNRITKEREDQKDQIAKLPKRKELWNDSTSFSLPFDPTDSLDQRVSFKVGADSLKNGIIRLQAVYNFKKGGFLDSAKMKMYACFADSTIDSLSYNIRKSFKPVRGNLSFTMPPEKTLMHIEGFLFDHDTTRESTVTIEKIKMTYIPTLEEMKMEP